MTTGQAGPRDTARQIAVVTGASSGIGLDLAHLLARDGYELVLVARREDRLRELAEALQREHSAVARVLPADLASREDRERLVELLAADRDRISVLVNNAGFGTHGFFHETSLDRELEEIEVNCAALTHLTKRVLPWMLANRRGRILNVASVASFQPGPLMAVYYATKAYVLSLSEALSNEVEGTGVTITASCPGPTRTEFTKAAGISPRARTSGAPPMTSREVAELSYQAMMRGKRVEVTGTRNKMVILLSRYLPRPMVLRSVRRIQEARRAATMADAAGGSSWDAR